MEARLSLLRRLERKYGTDADEFPILLKRMETEYRQLCDLEDQADSDVPDLILFAQHVRTV